MSLTGNKRINNHFFYSQLNHKNQRNRREGETTKKNFLTDNPRSFIPLPTGCVNEVVRDERLFGQTIFLRPTDVGPVCGNVYKWSFFFFSRGSFGDVTAHGHDTLTVRSYVNSTNSRGLNLRVYKAITFSFPELNLK